MQFAFRWMNCLLMREISVQNTIRMWDTYLVRPLSRVLSACHLTRHARRRAPTHSRNFICMYALPFSCSGAKSCKIWTFR